MLNYITKPRGLDISLAAKKLTPLLFLGENAWWLAYLNSGITAGADLFTKIQPNKDTVDESACETGGLMSHLPNREVGK